MIMITSSNLLLLRACDIYRLKGHENDQVINHKLTVYLILNDYLCCHKHSVLFEVSARNKRLYV